MDVLRGVGAEHLFRRVAEHPLHRRAEVAYGPVGAGNHDNIQRALGEGVEPPFAVWRCPSAPPVVVGIYRTSSTSRSMIRFGFHRIFPAPPLGGKARVRPEPTRSLTHGASWQRFREGSLPRARVNRDKDSPFGGCMRTSRPSKFLRHKAKRVDEPRR